jgi:hypothetical protein
MGPHIDLTKATLFKSKKAAFNASHMSKLEASNSMYLVIYFLVSKYLRTSKLMPMIPL